MKEFVSCDGFLFGIFFDPEDGSEMLVVFQRTTRNYIPEDKFS
jgi:hypothetical protein